MSQGMIALIGLATIVCSSALALSKKTHLAVPFIIVPIIGGMLCGFNFYQLMDFAHAGVNSCFNSILICVCAVLYFAILSDTGFFDIMVNRLVKITKGNVYVVLVITVLVGFIGHLDGAYNTTYLIAIPAMAPLYKALNIDRRLLVLLVSLAAGPMTGMSWANPAKQSMYDPDLNPVVMTQQLLPIIFIMLVLAVLYALWCGKRIYAKQGAELEALRNKYVVEEADKPIDWSNKPLARPQNFWMNMVLFIGSLLCFVFVTKVKTYLLFMIFSAIAWVLNYHDAKDQNAIFRKNANTMLAPGFLFMGIGVMVGILNNTGMVTAMVNCMLSVVPESMARYTHILWNIISLPHMVVIPYQAFTSITPVLMGIGQACGLTSYQILNPGMIGYINPCSPLIAANNLAAELAEVDIMELCKYSFLTCFVFNTIVKLLCLALGIA